MNLLKVRSFEFFTGLASWAATRLWNRSRLRPGAKPERILVIKQDFLGDQVVATAVYRSLRDLYPGSQIAVLVKPFLKASMAADRNIDRVFTSLDQLDGLRPELVIDLSPSWRSMSYALRRGRSIVRVDRSEVRLADTVRKFSYLIRGRVLRDLKVPHEIERHNALLRRAGIPAGNADTYFPVTAQGLGEKKRLLEKLGVGGYACIHPGAGKRFRVWRLENFARLGEMLHNRLGVSILVLGGVGDKDLTEELARILDAPAHDCGGLLSLEGLAAVIQGGRLFVGNDSGPSHLAAALGVPTVVLMGTADVARYRPRGKRVGVCYREVRCGPCYSGCYMPENICLQPVTPEQAMEEVGRLLGDHGGAAKPPQ